MKPKPLPLDESALRRLSKTAATQAALARAAGISEAAVSRFVRHERNVSFAVALRLLAALGYDAVAVPRPTPRKGARS